MRHGPGAGRSALPLALAAILAASPAVGAAAPHAPDVPVQRQALLLLRVMAYDRNLLQRSQSAVKVVVLFRPGDRGSVDRSATLVGAFEELSRAAVVGGLHVEVEGVPYRDGADLEARLAAIRPSLAYVDPGLAQAVPDITQASRRLRILTADGSRALVEAGIAIGLVANPGRAGLVVNLRAARQEGVDFDSALLAISEVLKD